METLLKPQLSHDEMVAFLEAQQKILADFQARTETLRGAYGAMQEDFKKINLELDKKNNQLAESMQRLEETRTYLGSILESMNNGVIGVDIMGTVTHFNRAAEEITGFLRPDVMGKPYADFFQKDAASEYTLLHVLRSGRERKGDEKILWHRDGHPVPVSFQTGLLRDQKGALLGAVEIFSDISHIKALEKEMQSAKTMAALGEMSAVVAHEIRNPLGAMGVWVGLLDRDLAGDDPRKQTLSKVTEGLQRLNRIVSNLLVYTRPLSGQFRKVALKELVVETIDFVAVEIESQNTPIVIDKRLPADATPLFIYADPEKIQQVIMNVCLNAVQAMPKGGTLSVTVDTHRQGDTRYASFGISDTGIGIEAAAQQKIFEPFFTTKEHGTGLGLAIVKKIVELHSGYIDVQSAPGAGTTVKIFIPQLKE
ncbi:MAG: ATP-binding protein [Chitinivibrionales bacterium]|nr:ATP-binding protein [Chitinivibrionales bacterium]